MDRAEVVELHYITHTDNVASILANGILSHRLSVPYHPVSVAMNEIQDRRAVRVVPQGQPIHSYACLYFHARNAMLYKIRQRHEELAILQINSAVLDTSNAIIADGNASSDYTRFYPSPSGLDALQSATVFARYWTSDDPYEQLRMRRARCAEVLVPDRIPSHLIMGAYVSGQAKLAELTQVGFVLPITINHDIFFGM